MVAILTALTRKGREVPRQIHTAMEKVQDHNLIWLVEIDHEMLTRSGKAHLARTKTLRQDRAVLPRNLSRSDSLAAGDQLGFIDIGLPGAECLNRPIGDIDQGCLGMKR